MFRWVSRSEILRLYRHLRSARAFVGKAHQAGEQLIADMEAERERQRMMNRAMRDMHIQLRSDVEHMRKYAGEVSDKLTRILYYQDRQWHQMLDKLEGENRLLQTRVSELRSTLAEALGE